MLASLVSSSRLLFRSVACLCFSVVGLLSVLMLRPLGWVSREAWLRARRFCYRTWARSICWALGLRIETRGSPPQLPYLLVSNHLSYIDVVVLASQQPARFVAKAEVSGWPLIGSMCRAVDTIFVDRKSRRDVLRVSELMRGALDEGEAVIFFPEGTSTNGHFVAGFRPSLLAPAAAGDLPVHAAALRYETAAGQRGAHEAVAWWGGMDFGPHILGLLRLPAVSVRLTYADDPIHHPDRKVLARQLYDCVSSHFEPMTDEPMPPGAAPILTPPIRGEFTPDLKTAFESDS